MSAYAVTVDGGFVAPADEEIAEFWRACELARQYRREFPDSIVALLF